MPFPGTKHHQAILQSIATHYERDPRVLALVLFGSLVAGNWDAHSDLDLDVVIADGVMIDIRDELPRLCESLENIGEKAAIIVPDGRIEGDVVLESLMQFSIKYHPLVDTHPNVVDNMMLLTGSLDGEQIRTAGLANKKPPDQTLAALLDACVRYMAGADVTLLRGEFWSTVELLHRIRNIWLELYTRTHNGRREYKFFEAKAEMINQVRLGKTLPTYGLPPMQGAFLQFLAMFENDLGDWTNYQVQLSAGQRTVLNKIYLRQLTSQSKLEKTHDNHSD